jgi:hypothetical protein
MFVGQQTVGAAADPQSVPVVQGYINIRHGTVQFVVEELWENMKGTGLLLSV